MTDNEILNEFLNKQDLSDFENTLKSQIFSLDSSLKNNIKEREGILQNLKTKEEEFLRLSGAFDAQVRLVVQIVQQARAKAVEPPK